MTVAPVRRSIVTEAPPALAFELFTAHIGAWWPKGQTPARLPHSEVVIEPHAGGRWFERDGEGTETQWGNVLAFEPPRRLLLAWQLNRDFKFDPALVTEVELIFEPEGEGTRVSLEHRYLERLGANVDGPAGRIREGWGERLGDFRVFADYAAAGAKTTRTSS